MIKLKNYKKLVEAVGLEGAGLLLLLLNKAKDKKIGLGLSLETTIPELMKETYLSSTKIKKLIDMLDKHHKSIIKLERNKKDKITWDLNILSLYMKHRILG